MVYLSCSSIRYANTFEYQRATRTVQRSNGPRERQVRPPPPLRHRAALPDVSGLRRTAWLCFPCDLFCCGESSTQTLHQKMVHLAVEAYEVAIINPPDKLGLGGGAGGGGGRVSQPNTAKRCGSPWPCCACAAADAGR
jgi:hypothetical protein